MRLRERLAQWLLPGAVPPSAVAALEAKLTAQSERLREAVMLRRPDDAQMVAQGFRQLTTGRLRSIRELPPLAQDQMLRVVNWLRESNPLAEWILNTTVDFTLGEGYKLDTEDPRVQAVLDALTDDPVNQLSVRFDQWALEFGMYGELCLPAFENAIDGHVRLGYVDPFAIDYVITDPQNVLIRDAVVLKTLAGGLAPITGAGGATAASTPTPPGQNKQLVLKVIRQETARNSPYFGLMMPAMPSERQPLLNVPYDGSCFLFQTNHVSNATRGRSDLLPLIDWLDGYDQFLFDAMDNANLFNTFVYDARLEGMTEEQIQVWLQKFGTKLKKGEVFAHNEKITLSAVTPDLKANDKDLFLRDLRGHIIGSKAFPEHWFGMGGHVNLASAKEMGLPPVKRLTRRQKELKGILTTILQYGIDCKVRAGELPKTVVIGQVAGDGTSKGVTVPTSKAFEVMMPELSMRDSAGIVAAVTALTAAMSQATAQGWIRPETAAKLFAAQVSQLGVDVDAEKEFTPGTGPAGAALQDYGGGMGQPGTQRLMAQLLRYSQGNGENLGMPKSTSPVGGRTSESETLLRELVLALTKEAMHEKNGAPAPVINVTTPDVTVNQAPITVEAPDFTVNAPDVTVEAPTVNVTPPSVTVESPTVNVTTPDVTVHQAPITVATPDVTVNLPPEPVTMRESVERDEQGRIAVITRTPVRVAEYDTACTWRMIKGRPVCITSGHDSHGKSPDTMTPREINTELDHLEKESSALVDQIIAAGDQFRGMGMGDIAQLGRQPNAPSLAKDYAANADRTRALRNEIAARYGPGSPGRLPTHKRGEFGPRAR